jgi:hypothetical protein
MIDLHPQSAEGQCSRLGYAPYPFCYCYRFVKRGGNALPRESSLDGRCRGPCALRALSLASSRSPKEPKIWQQWNCKLPLCRPHVGEGRASISLSALTLRVAGKTAAVEIGYRHWKQRAV